MTNSIDLTLPWCTYRTTHVSGFYYLGKARTKRVLNGSYKGSGVNFKLAQTVVGFEYDTWTCCVLETFATEEEAYAAEELLVPIALLADPYLMNINAGGQVGKYRNRSTLMRSITAERRAANKRVKMEKARLKKQIAANTIKQLKKQLKDTNGNK